MKPSARIAALLACLGPFAASDVAGGESRAILAPAPPIVPDARLTDPQGHILRFQTDILDRGPTLVTFTYQGCRAQCPVSDVIAGQVETLLERSGAPDARIVTLTLDPSGRTADLRDHSERIGVGTRRTLLGGDLVETAPLLEGLGVPFGSLDDHSLFFLVFDAAGRFAGRVEFRDATPEHLLERLRAASGPARHRPR